MSQANVAVAVVVVTLGQHQHWRRTVLFAGGGSTLDQVTKIGGRLGSLELGSLRLVGRSLGCLRGFGKPESSCTPQMVAVGDCMIG